MLFGESDITWDDLEKVTDGYFDGFAKEDSQIKAASDLVEYLTVGNTTSLLVEMLKMKTGDISDVNTEDYGRERTRVQPTVHGQLCRFGHPFGGDFH